VSVVLRIEVARSSSVTSSALGPDNVKTVPDVVTEDAVEYLDPLTPDLPVGDVDQSDSIAKHLVVVVDQFGHPGVELFATVSCPALDGLQVRQGYRFAADNLDERLVVQTLPEQTGCGTVRPGERSVLFDCDNRFVHLADGRSLAGRSGSRSHSEYIVPGRGENERPGDDQ
jgi:hypothetical protein